MTSRRVTDSKLKDKKTSYTDKPKEGAEKDTLKMVMDMHKDWKSYSDKLKPDYIRDTKLYNNERVSKNRYRGVADTFVPMTFGTIETMVAALATGNLNTDFIPQDIYKYLQERFEKGFEEGGEMSKEQFLVEAIREAVSGGVIEDETLDVLNALYDYFWDIGNWDNELENLVRDGLKTGTGAWWLTWNVDHPELVTVPFPDYIFDPTASGDKAAKYNGRRYMADIDELRNEEIADTDPKAKTGAMKKRYNIPEDISKANSKSEKDKHDKQMKEELLFGSTVDYDAKKDNKQVEVIEIQTDDRCYTVLNRQYLIEDEVNPFKAQAELMGIEYDGFLSGITWANYKDNSLLVGRSETATFWQEQERLNDVTNQKSDAVTRALIQQKLVDPALKSQKNSMGITGAVLWGTAGQVANIPQDQVPPLAFGEENSIKNNIREVTATDQIVKGVGSDSDVTATEAKLQVAQSGQRIEMKIKSLERGPLKVLAIKTLYLTQLFISDPFIVPQPGSNGISAVLFDPSKYSGNFIPKVKLTIDAKNSEKREQAEQLNTYQILIQDPTNNLQAVKELLLPKITGFDKDEVKRISEQPQPEEMMGEQLPPEELPAEEMLV